VIPNIRFNHHEDGEQIAKTVQFIYNPRGDTVISRFDRDGDLMGGVIYTGYTGPKGSVGMHYAGFHPRWFSRDMLFVCFDYPFNQLGVKKIFGQVPVMNEEVVKLNCKLGFKAEEVIKDVYPDGDMLLMSMYRDDCRYLDIVPSFAKEAPDGRES